MPKRRTGLISLALTVAIVACSDTTAPPNKPFALTIAQATPITPAFSDAPDGPRITCTFGLTAIATGTGSAQFQDVRTTWYFGRDRTIPANVTTNTAAEAQGAFGSASISGGQTLRANWYLYAGAPFDADVGFAYTVANGTTSTATTHITCGPKPDGAVVPTITQLSVPSTTGELKVGDVITVTYQATGASGIWESIVQVTGGFQSTQRFGERLATSANHTVQFVVPNDVKPGIPITISAIVVNSALVGTSKAINTQLTFVDRSPPTIYQAYVPDVLRLAGQYAVSDTIPFEVYARDNAQLGWLVYELGSPANVKDSVAATPGSTDQRFVLNLPVRPEWVGSPVVSFTVRDASGQTSATVSSAPDSIRVYPIVNRPVMPALALSSNATNDIVYDAKRDLMYIGIQNSNQVLVLSPSTMTLQSSIHLPQAPEGMDLSLSGDSLFAAMPLDGTIAVVDLNDPSATPSKLRLSVLDTTMLSPNIPVAPSGLRIAANGKMIVMLTNMTANRDQTVEVDLTTGAQRIRSDARALSTVSPHWTQFMGRPADRSRIYSLGLDCWSWYDASSNTFASCSSSDYADFFMGLTFDATGQRLTRGIDVFDARAHLLWAVPPIMRLGTYAALSPDGTTVYLGAGQSLTTARLADKTMLSRSPLPLTAERLFVAPSGSWLLAFQNSNGARVTRVDLQ